MGFKVGKANVYSRMKTELKEAKQELAREKESKYVEAFAREFGNNMLVILATTSFKDWPKFAQDVFKHTETKAQIAAYMYKERLPK